MQKLNDLIFGVIHPLLITINLSPLDFTLVSYFSVLNCNYDNVAQALKVAVKEN